VANVYTSPFLKYWRTERCDEVIQTQVVFYTVEFVILSHSKTAEPLEWSGNVMTRLGLNLNEKKRAIRGANRLLS
jgi:hypothetical protein